MFAVIQTGGKQYKVSAGEKLEIEKLEAQEGEAVVFDKVLLVGNEDGSDLKIGAPYVDGAKVQAKVLKQDKQDTVIVFRYHSKTRRRKKKGHRQRFTQVEIVSIK